MATWWIFTPPSKFLPTWKIYPSPKNVRNAIIIANTNIFIARKIPPELYSPKISPSKHVLTQVILVNYYFLGNLHFSYKIELQNFCPRGKVFEFDNILLGGIFEIPANLFTRFLVFDSPKGSFRYFRYLLVVGGLPRETENIPVYWKHFTSNLDPRAIMPFSSRDSTASYGPGSYPIVGLLRLANEITKELSKFNHELH